MHPQLSELPTTARTYLQYLERLEIPLDSDLQTQLYTGLAQTDWEDPQTALDLNNIAVIALIEAEQADNSELRSVYFETAIEALQAAQGQHPLCAIHFAIAQGLIGNSAEARQLAFSGVISNSEIGRSAPLGLVYLPTEFEHRHRFLETILTSANGDGQAQRLSAAALVHCNPIFYNPLGQRFLTIAETLFPQSVTLQLKQGLARLMSGQWEGLLNLQRAIDLQPQRPAILQSLCLAYRSLGDLTLAEFYQHRGQAIRAPWANLPLDSTITHCPFEHLHFVIDASFQSLVTGVLLGAGDWFEAEMEFWRDRIQPGMTVLDVGANVGIYTFSAAQQVGAQGQVLAIEPFSKCIAAMVQTCEINQLSQVTVCRGAASDHEGTLKLALQSSSELNEVCAEDVDLPEGSYEAVPCFTLDSLIDHHRLTQVDFLKIDAEGHELQVLMGSDRLLKEFKPTILYENIAGSKGSNLTVAQFLQENGYQLCRYQPFLKQLLPLDATESFDDCLNVIAIPR
ncbi:FkbM family methyltransferase [Alkalinema pantanalense CENA528]|uniref:FkbM family methyltransferase n=1 Tax=Alkalinema pantanalense TaxID=1620705 RepID=UPI003D6DDF05